MSGSGTSTVLAKPGAHWKFLWGNGFDNFQLDIVGFLAVLGEGSVTANAQVSALSSLFYLPRLIPAPQALLWPSRPVELQTTKATVTGVESGMVKEHVHHVANVLLGDEMKKHTVRCVEVTKSTDREGPLWERLLRQNREPVKDPEKEHAAKQHTGPPEVKAKANGPMAWVTLSSCFLSIVMFILSVIWGDGLSLIATLLLSFLSTLIGVVNKSTLYLPQRPKDAAALPKGNVVIRYPNGSFLVVKCDEDVARELYFAPEEIDYKLKNHALYRLLSLMGTLMLMGGVIALANARLQLQMAWAGAYILTNVLHWVAAALPARLHWDLSCYNVCEVPMEGGHANANFTEALFKCIVFTRNTEWVGKGSAAPRTEVWDEWLQLCGNKVRDLNVKIASETSSCGRKWDVPKNFNAKREWDMIDRRHKESVKRG